MLANVPATYMGTLPPHLVIHVARRHVYGYVAKLSTNVHGYVGARSGGEAVKVIKIGSEICTYKWATNIFFTFNFRPYMYTIKLSIYTHAIYSRLDCHKPRPN